MRGMHCCAFGLGTGVLWEYGVARSQDLQHAPGVVCNLTPQMEDFKHLGVLLMIEGKMEHDIDWWPGAVWRVWMNCRS